MAGINKYSYKNLNNSNTIENIGKSSINSKLHSPIPKIKNKFYLITKCDSYQKNGSNNQYFKEHLYSKPKNINKKRTEIISIQKLNHYNDKKIIPKKIKIENSNSIKKNNESNKRNKSHKRFGKKIF